MEASAALLKEQTVVLGHMIVFNTLMYFLNPPFFISISSYYSFKGIQRSIYFENSWKSFTPFVILKLITIFESFKYSLAYPSHKINTKYSWSTSNVYFFRFPLLISLLIRKILFNHQIISLFFQPS